MENSKEVWKSIKGYEGRYEISDHGRVKSLNYRKKGFSQRLKPQLNSGYLTVNLWDNYGLLTVYKVHTLVLEAFVSPRPYGYVCDHIDSNPANNFVSNLEWVTHEENVRRGRSSEVARKRRGSKTPNAKLNEQQVLEIRAKHLTGGVTCVSLAKDYGVTDVLIGLIIRRKYWTHI